MSVFTAIATGLKEGVEGYGENVRRAKAIERDDQRFEWEKSEQESKIKQRKAADEYASFIKKINDDRAAGLLPGADDNVVQAAPVAQPQSGDAAAVPTGRQSAITAPGAAQQAAPTMAAPSPDQAPAKPDDSANIFKSGGEGKYKNQKLADDAYYDKLYQGTASYLAATGQQDKIFDLRKRVNEMREQGYEPLRKAAAAAVALGEPNALQLVAKASQVSGTPMNIDPNGATFDAETQTYKNVGVVSPDGKVTRRDLSAAQLLAGIGSLDAGKAIEFQFGRADKAKSQKIEQQKADADTIKANAYASSAADNAATNRDTRSTNAAIRDRQQQINEDSAATKFFGSAFGLKEIEVKAKDEIEAMLPKQREAYEKQRTEQTQRREIAGYAQNLYSLNERKVPPAQIAQLIPALRRRIASGKGADGVDESTGLPYVTFNGKKILLPKD
jgi:hypothetical protein